MLIGRIEEFRGETVVSIKIRNLPVQKDRHTKLKDDCQTEDIFHTPFLQSAVLSSVDRLKGTHQQPDEEFEKGYAVWKDYTDDGGGDPISETIAESIQTSFDIIRSCTT
ncbi:hypothetical protein FF098_005625 [Parvularcula flava]|uniref:Uncharacterized protein n=1 Tax=Aquisalinus luteolus TaxID=1566827 RepID=A0A8J3A325_9PROT|nr:hypothetical protein [Aquisalinus luteolus]NHK27378.1 hypothetical protein [Aquisalinus luteolus]GGH95255.1 hypothetical protein GCM10011355_11360 [Aquisalinus luteolus]